LGLDLVDEPEGLLARLREAAREGGPWREAAEALELDPSLARRWFLESRGLGVWHPLDAALASLEASAPPSAPPQQVPTRPSDEPKERQRLLRALLELPDLAPSPWIAGGLDAARGSGSDPE
jgi:hypothetical protein